MRTEVKNSLTITFEGDYVLVRADGDKDMEFAEFGHKKLEQAAPDHVDSVRRHIFDHLDESQVAALGTIFEAISKGLGGQCTTSSDESA